MKYFSFYCEIDFHRAAHEAGAATAIVNVGVTRADDFVPLKINARLGEVWMNSSYLVIFNTTACCLKSYKLCIVADPAKSTSHGIYNHTCCIMMLNENMYQVIHYPNFLIHSSSGKI